MSRLLRELRQASAKKIPQDLATQVRGRRPGAPADTPRGRQLPAHGCREAGGAGVSSADAERPGEAAAADGV